MIWWKMCAIVHNTKHFIYLETKGEYVFYLYTELYINTLILVDRYFKYWFLYIVITANKKLLRQFKDLWSPLPKIKKRLLLF